MTHELDEENVELCRKLQKLQFYTLEFVPPLIVTSTLPCAIHADIVARDITSDPVLFELNPGQHKEVCDVNTGGKWLNFGVRVSGMRRTEILLPRKDGFSKEMQLHCTGSASGDGCAADAQMRILFTVCVSECGQVHIDVFSPVWIMNRSSISIDVMMPRWRSVYQMGTCLTEEDNDVVSCKPWHESKHAQLQLLGYSGMKLFFLFYRCHWCGLDQVSACTPVLDVPIPTRIQGGHHDTCMQVASH
jgi:hypothetical protein